jgi:hypothetical protein
LSRLKSQRKGLQRRYKFAECGIKTTMNIYTHVTKKAKEKSAEKFAAYIEM